MSLHPKPFTAVPEETACVARAAFPQGNESINNPGEQLIPQLSGTRYLVVFQARAFSPPPTC